LRELAATHVRYGYGRLTVLLRRDGWKVNAKRILRLYDEDAIEGCVAWSAIRSIGARVSPKRWRLPQTSAGRPISSNDKLADRPSVSHLTVIDQFTPECVWLEA
jgi:putative transposase